VANDHATTAYISRLQTAVISIVIPLSENIAERDLIFSSTLFNQRNGVITFHGEKS
jgi:hypothetical protein